ncbi:MAG: ATP-binding protein [Nanoarchaeota archaeon]|nr:ATP-binding protein [Nanoarchaeota archaeon]
MHTIAVTGGKGGTGKSTIASSLAVVLSEQKKVLLADVDVDCPNDHLILDVERKKLVDVFQSIPQWEFDKCTKCGTCASVCKQNAIVAVKGKNPAFVPELCIGCKACIVACPVKAIQEGRKKIGKIYSGDKYGVHLVSGELKLGELASGEMVVETRKVADDLAKKNGFDIVLVDSAAGIGCPVIASLHGTDFVVAVTEPTPSALHDLKRVLYLADHFRIPRGIVLNKADMDTGFAKKIEQFAKNHGIPILGRLPYRQDVVKATIKMKPIVIYDKRYKKTFIDISNTILRGL